MIINLISDDLVHFKLIESLDAMGLDTAIYCIDIGSTILELMNFPDEHNERAFVYYLSLKRPILEVDLHEGIDQVRKVAVRIFDKLEIKKRSLK